MTREEYKAEISRLRRSRKLRKNNRLPRDVFEFGWEIAKFKAQHWMVERVLFWMYAYDHSHKWTKKDFLYEINDEAYEKAKAKRKERAALAKEKRLKRHNKPRPFPDTPTDWSEVSGPPQELIDQLWKTLGKTKD